MLNYKNKYKNLVKPYQNDLINSIKGFVKINSVYDETTKSEVDPFGKGVSDALKFIENLAKQDGFEVCNYANKVVEIIYGEGEKNVTILAHCDVVPATGEWSHDPFDVKEENGYLYGRGVSDDKGPCLASYYALKALKDNDLIKGYKVRLLVGGNEESGSLCMEYYFNELKKYQPTYGFTPDSDFPIIRAEKGIVNFNVFGKWILDGVESFEGGVVPNAVIDKLKVKIVDDNLLNFLKLNLKDYEIKDDLLIIKGKSAHGAQPYLGVNAAILLFNCLKQYYNDEKLSIFIDKLTSLTGDTMNVGFKNDDMGQCSLNLGLISYKENQINITYNYRFINGVDFDEVKKTISEELKPLKVEFSEPSRLLYFDEDSKLIKTLMKAYQEETNDKVSKPLAIGGGTYAKECQNVVAYGMQFPNEDTHMHEADELVKIEHLYKAMAIYANAIEKLGKLIKDED